MQAPRKPEPAPEANSKRIFYVCLAALLLIGGWLWMHYARKPNPPKVATRPDSTAVSATDTVAADTVQVATSLAAKPKKTPVATPAARTTRATSAAAEPSAETAREDVVPPAQTEKKAVPPPCDQIVLRNGDLVDAVISEIGVNGVRYKKCRWSDGPDYVVPRNEVLSIRYANGEVERL